MNNLPLFRLVFSLHAIKRMFERAVTKADIRRVLVNGEVIKEYPEDKPYPSKLILGWSGNRPLHIVIATDAKEQKVYIVTVYDPDRDQWEPNLRSKRS